MLFQPSKKPTYYRFPSLQSVTELDNRMYFPEKPSDNKEDIRHDYDVYDYMPEKENINDI